jgi:uncharacterized protein
MGFRKILFPIIICFVVHTGFAAVGTFLPQQDNEKAAAAFGDLLKAAEKGDAKSQYDLANAYMLGNGVKADYEKAIKWFHKAADAGEVRAEDMLGLMYFNGKGSPQDYDKAAKWFQKAADKGDADAQFNLGIMCAEGKGIKQNYIQAHMWFSLSAADLKGSVHDKAVLSRDTISKKMTPQQIEEAQNLAKEWKPKGAK